MSGTKGIFITKGENRHRERTRHLSPRTVTAVTTRSDNNSWLRRTYAQPPDLLDRMSLDMNNLLQGSNSPKYWRRMLNLSNTCAEHVARVRLKYHFGVDYSWTITEN